ncbi:unnamed protein product [Microthlaspi erraticum]|uniref:DUF4283 domain-containing protein n=1 Tax=Microthlaspi erraticum TaxID=1685480 RepID=A0A6D2HX77_9BRAS|nr:unnamed protein product [Microthlaspi erraticum]
MAGRFPYSEKGKGIAYDKEPSLRKRIQAPELDTTDFEEENSLTLIGRVTNPHEQRIRALIPYFTNRWELKGNIVGSDLGNNCFQFRFRLKEDLQRILNNRPYQFARWMVVLQKWEPVISNTFPSQIPFCIQLKGIPLHYWKPKTICNIGKEVGELLRHEITKTEVKIYASINVLLPLVKETVLEFASGAEALVTLEYERLGNHCRICNRLSHAETDCPENVENTNKTAHAATYNNPSQAPKTTERVRSTNEEMYHREQRGQRESSQNSYQRRDRHGNHIGERSFYSNVPKEVSRERSGERIQSPSPRPTYSDRRNYQEYTSRAAPPQYTNERNLRGSQGENQRGSRSQSQLNQREEASGRFQWREVGHRSRGAQLALTERSESSRPRRQEVESAQRTSPSPIIQGIPTTEEVMEDLQDVTICYVNVADPVERAARRQRVMQPEDQELMETTAANIVAAATESYYRTLQFDQEEEVVVNEALVPEETVIPETQQINTKKRRGRPPKSKRNSPMVGTSIRGRRFTQASPGNKKRLTKTAPTNDVGPSRPAASHQAPTLSSSSRQAPIGTIIPAISKATGNFRPQSNPLP